MVFLGAPASTEPPTSVTTPAEPAVSTTKEGTVGREDKPSSEEKEEGPEGEPGNAYLYSNALCDESLVELTLSPCPQFRAG